MNPFPGWRNLYRSHSRGSGGLDSHRGVFKHQARVRRHTETRSGTQKTLRMRFAPLVVAGANQCIESVEQTEPGKRSGYRVERAAGNDCERKLTVSRFDMLQNLGNRFQLRQQSEVEIFLAMRDLLDGHPESALA